MSYFDLSKIKISRQLENNYDMILEEYYKFDSLGYFNILDFFKIDKNFHRWKKIYNFSVKNSQNKNIINSSTELEPYRKKYGHYGLKVNGEIVWESIVLATRKKFFGIEYMEQTPICKNFFSNTFKILEPNMEVLSFAIAKFSPNKKIFTHRGDKNIIRLHLGLIIPEGDIGFCVRGVYKKWKEGKCLAFNDFYEHMGWNNTQKERIILIVDLDRKMVIKK